MSLGIRLRSSSTSMSRHPEANVGRAGKCWLCHGSMGFSIRWR